MSHRWVECVSVPVDSPVVVVNCGRRLVVIMPRLAISSSGEAALFRPQIAHPRRGAGPFYTYLMTCIDT